MSTGIASGHGHVPVAPLIEAINADLERIQQAPDFESVHNARFPGIEVLAARSKLNPRLLWGILSGERATVRLHTADTFCVKTGRHLSDLYPELYPELFEGPCRCGQVWLWLVQETDKQITLRCPECGKMRYLRSPSGWRQHSGQYSRTPGMELEEVRRLRVEEGWPNQRIADKFGVTVSCVSRWLRHAGVPPARGNDRVRDSDRRHAHAVVQARAWTNTWRAQVTPFRVFADLALVLGMTAPGAVKAYRRWSNWAGPWRECECGHRMPDLPAEVVDQAPDLAHCPRCVHGEALAC